MLHDFYLYTGSTKEKPSQAGVTGDHVLRLSDSLEEYIGHKLYADNYFVSLPLIRKLQANGFEFTGTFRPTRIPLSFECDRKMKPRERFD